MDFEEEDKLDKKDWEEEQSNMQQDISYKASKVEIKWNKEGEQNLHKRYKKSLKRTQMRHTKSDQDLEKKLLKYTTLRYYGNKVKTWAWFLKPITRLG